MVASGAHTKSLLPAFQRWAQASVQCSLPLTHHPAAAGTLFRVLHLALQVALLTTVSFEAFKVAEKEAACCLSQEIVLHLTCHRGHALGQSKVQEILAPIQGGTTASLQPPSIKLLALHTEMLK